MRYRFTDPERRDRIDLLASECAVTKQNRSPIIKAGATVYGHQTQRNFRRRAKQPREEITGVSRQRYQTFRLFPFIRARAFRQKRADPFTVSAAVDAIPAADDKEWQRVQRLFEDAVAVRAL